MQRTLITTRARQMRKEMTEPERMLWSRLRGREDGKPRFRRQHVFGAVILDFYCTSARLAVEVDGATHWEDDARAKDEARDRWLARQGILTMRVPAGWIYRDLRGVADAVLKEAMARSLVHKGCGCGLPPPPPALPTGRVRWSAGGPPPPASLREKGI